jgi:hypothetical protein
VMRAWGRRRGEGGVATRIRGAIFSLASGKKMMLMVRIPRTTHQRIDRLFFLPVLLEGKKREVSAAPAEAALFFCWMARRGCMATGAWYGERCSYVGSVHAAAKYYIQGKGEVKWFLVFTSRREKRPCVPAGDWCSHHAESLFDASCPCWGE